MVELIFESTKECNGYINKLTLDSGSENSKDYSKEVGGTVKQSTLDGINEKVKHGGAIIVKSITDGGGSLKQLALRSGVVIVGISKDGSDVVKQFTVDAVEKVKHNGSVIAQSGMEYGDKATRYAKENCEVVKKFTLDGIEKAKQDGSLIVENTKEYSGTVKQYAKDHPYQVLAIKIVGGTLAISYGVPTLAHFLGFGVTGIAKGSTAAQMMSKLYQGSRIVANLQSIGAKSSILHLINPASLGIGAGLGYSLHNSIIQKSSSLSLFGLYRLKRYIDLDSSINSNSNSSN